MNAKDAESATCALEFADHTILPILGRHLKDERDAEVRERIIEIIGQHRVPSAIPILVEALFDESPLVWKKALDWLVTLDRPRVHASYRGRAKPVFSKSERSEYFKEWVDEAIHQLREALSIPISQTSQSSGSTTSASPWKTSRQKLKNLPPMA
ncbi:MAG: HEAT repeat domain-containing protein [Acidobacteriota bacterium]